MSITSTDPRAQMLGTFMRAHREHTSPESLGLATSGRRRTPGLRREELASLAGVGIAWYTWLEQGRVLPSPQVLESLARSLRMGPRTRAHMFALARVGEASPPPSGAERAEDVAFLVREWQLGPAFVMDRWFDIVEENAAFAEQWRGRLDTEEPNLMRLLSDLDGVDRMTGGDARRILRAHLPHFRVQTAVHPNVRRVAEIYETLQDADRSLTDWWTCQSMDGDSVLHYESTDHHGTTPMRQVMLRYDGGLTVVLQQEWQPDTADHRMTGRLPRPLAALRS